MTKKRLLSLFLTLCMLISVMLVFSSCQFPFFWEEEYEIPEGSAEFHFVDVGQGDATLIFADGKTVLIDTGENDSKNVLINYLEDKGVETINYFIITHFDSDHFGEATEILETFDVENLIIPDQVKTTKMYKTFMETVASKPEIYVSVVNDDDDIGNSIEVDDVIEIDSDDRYLYVGETDPEDTTDKGDLRLKFLAPVKDSYSNSNDYSIIFLVEWGKNSVLFTGDAEEKAEDALIDEYSPFLSTYIDCDVFKAGHHGSKTSSCQEIVDAASPEYVIISCGYQNDYRHPHSEAMERFESAVGEENIYRTDLQGTIILTTDGELTTITTQN